MNDLDAAERVLRSAGWGERNPEPDEVTLLRAAIAFRCGRFDEADAMTDAVISSETVRRDDYLLKGRIRQALGDPDGALNRFSAATALSPTFADAYFEAAKIHYARHDVVPARMALEKTLYYDNTQAPAFVMLALINDDRRLPLEAIRSRNADGEAGADDVPPISLVKGETRVVDVTLTGLPHPSRCRIGLLEPYGFGIRSTLVRSEMIGSPDGQTTISLAIRLTGVRDDSINLGRPWPLTIVAADLDSGAYVTARRFVSVEDRPGEEGRILFVMTEDLEQTGDFPHVDDTPEVMDNDADEIRIDFIDKPAFADALANEFGVKWSHMVDVGSAILRLQWLRDGAYGGAWNDLWDRMAAYLERTVSAGHDVQLHIHGYNIPGNRLFRQFFDTEQDRVMFTGNRSRVANADGHHGAGAANYERLGNRDDVESRWGSIGRGVRELEGLLHESHPAYATTFFRAGEYEFGQSGTDTTRSIVALRASGILADSSAVSGSPFRRDFKFFRRAGRNVYFSRPDRIQERALSLQDIGILELLPVPRLHGHDYLGPTDEFRHVQYNYDLCMEGGRVRNDIFVLMEMYHLGNANHAHQWNRLDADYQDWKRMRDQWRRLRRECPRIEPVTATEAIRIWLDRYAPDVIARRGAERKLSDGVYQYEVELLGADIEVSDQRPHFVALQPPSYWMNRIDKIELLQYGSVVATWTGVTGCDHLEFRVTTLRGYSLKVYVKPNRTPGAGGEAAGPLESNERTGLDR